jgi:hypothetical protein
MKKEILRYILKIIVQDFENLATSEQITKFKNKYSGVNWQKTMEKDLLEYANTAIAMKRWIENVILFMVEHGIAIEGEKSPQAQENVPSRSRSITQMEFIKAGFGLLI